MRKTLGVCLLVLLLTGSASAGEMPNDKPAPPPQSASAIQEPTNAAQEPTTGDEMLNDVTDSLTGIALELLSLLPSLL